MREHALFFSIEALLNLNNARFGSQVRLRTVDHMLDHARSLASAVQDPWGKKDPSAPFYRAPITGTKRLLHLLPLPNPEENHLEGSVGQFECFGSLEFGHRLQKKNSRLKVTSDQNEKQSFQREECLKLKEGFRACGEFGQEIVFLLFGVKLNQKI